MTKSESALSSAIHALGREDSNLVPPSIVDATKVGTTKFQRTFYLHAKEPRPLIILVPTGKNDRVVEALRQILIVTYVDVVEIDSNPWKMDKFYLVFDESDASTRDASWINMKQWFEKKDIQLETIYNRTASSSDDMHARSDSYSSSDASDGSSSEASDDTSSPKAPRDDFNHVEVVLRKLWKDAGRPHRYVATLLRYIYNPADAPVPKGFRESSPSITQDASKVQGISRNILEELLSACGSKSPNGIYMLMTNKTKEHHVLFQRNTTNTGILIAPKMRAFMDTLTL